jgi:hypothetical protein
VSRSKGGGRDPPRLSVQPASLPKTRERCRRRFGLPSPDSDGSVLLAKHHYGFEKRQRELKKEQKKEEKRQRKLDRRSAQEAGDADQIQAQEDPEGERKQA